MKRFKKMKFNDLWALIGRSEEFNGYQVNPSCATIMERMAQTMGRLAVMGDDERRTLWLPFITRRKHGGWDFVEPEKGLLWYKISIQQYKGIYYLIINDLQRQCVIYKSNDDHCGGRVIHEYEAERVEKALLQLEEYVQTIVDWIVAKPEEYNTYITENLPYRKRHGKIQRSVLYKFISGYRRLEDRTEKMQLLEQLKMQGPTMYETMTLNTYARVWRIAWDTYQAANADIWDRKGEDETDLTDREMFIRHSNKGNEAEKFDWDSEADFVQWKQENSSYHNLDVAYARIHLWPHHDEETGLWHYHLSFSVYGYYPDVLIIAEALYKQGICVELSPFDRVMGILREDDLVGIVPYPDKYMDRGGTTNQIRLPYVEEDVTEEKLLELILLTEWEPEEQVQPL